ncbi:restriction endonuclease [Pseudoalteromonas sp. SR43-7]|uniref:restriction endonuclease n=1 Tax=Pseudoalteromonas sp. SR43-7 TaxID=2760939 RepID=UPI0015F8BA31|nr:restriction endonuclease [Pseudoalteromonas sp. SR43-7]MBB1330883.1 restriction endonuclease [Pseudoalteromonas sp. SR43-7]
MTIVEAIKQVLYLYKDGLTYPEIYKKVIEQKLYTFGAKDPKAIVRSKLRQHCYGVDYPSASPSKHFVSDGAKGNKALYKIWDGKSLPKQKSSRPIDHEAPEEVIDDYYKSHIKNIENQIMDGIYNSDPGFFEKLLLKLLIELGYGWDKERAGFHTGGPNDRGVDGVIFEDQLGLERVYLQAKRYGKSKSIGPSDIQQFIGAMNTKNANKGVFITSSYFTKAAKEEANDARNISLVLIDGEKLSELLRKNGLGVSVSETYKTYTIDSDAFKDN